MIIHNMETSIFRSMFESLLDDLEEVHINDYNIVYSPVNYTREYLCGNTTVIDVCITLCYSTSDRQIFDNSKLLQILRP